MTERPGDPADDRLQAELRDYFADRCAAAQPEPFEVLLRRAEQRRRARAHGGPVLPSADVLHPALRRRRAGWALAAGLAAAVLVGGGLWRAADHGPVPAELASASLTGQLAASTWWQAPSDRLLGSQLGDPPAPVPRLRPPTLAPQLLPMDRIRTGLQGG